MKRYLMMMFGSIFVLILSVSSCKDDDTGTCPNDIASDIEDNNDIHYGKLYSCGDTPDGDYTRYYKNSDDYYNDPECVRLPIPVNLDFDGIILAQGVKLPFTSEDESENPAYELDVELSLDDCSKHVDFNFILTNVDTFQHFEHNRNVIVLLEGIDSTYTVDFSHEIIPLGE